MINAVKGTCWPSTTITVCHSTGKRSAGLKHCRASGSPGAGAKRAGLPRVMHPPRGHARGRFRNSGSQHPLPLLLPLPRSRHRASRNPLAALRFARRLPNRTLRLGGEWGWERPPSERPIYSPAIRTCASPFATCQGRSQPAPAARSIPAGRLRTRLGGGWAAGDVSAATGSSMRTKAPSHRSPRPLWTSLARSPTLGSRRASAGAQAACSARGTRAATTTVRRYARSAPVRGPGARPRPSVATAAAREAGGSEGGHRQGHRPRQLQCVHTG